MNRLLLLFTSSLLICVSAQADAIYNVSVNTIAYRGQPGYIDFQLGRGPDSQSLSAAVNGFSTDGVLSATPADIAGGVFGALPGTVTLTNSAQFNDYFKGLTYGTTLAFAVVLSGPAINAPNGTSLNGSPFYFGLYNASQQPIGTNDGFGNALLIQVNPNGSTRAQTYNSAVTVSSAAVPEPSAFALLAIGATAVLALRRRAA